MRSLVPRLAAGKDAARYGKYLAPLLQRKAGGDPRPAAHVGFDDDGAQGQTADDAIAGRKVSGIGAGSQGVLADQRPSLHNLGCQACIRGGIVHIHPTAQHGDCAPASLQAGPVGHGVDPPGQPADDRHARLGQPAAHHARCLFAIDRSPPRADDGHRPLVPFFDAAAHIEQGRSVVDLAQV